MPNNKILLERFSGRQLLFVDGIQSTWTHVLAHTNTIKKVTSRNPNWKQMA
jgi:hypothetical protein